MSTKSSEQLKNALLSTVAQVEQESGASPDDPALVALKKIVLQRIADLELAQAVDPYQASGTIDSGSTLPAGESQHAQDEVVTEDPQSKGDKLA